MAQTFGQVIPVTGALVGFPGNRSRVNADDIVVAREVSPTTATNLPFGAGAVIISNATGGYFQSLADFLATASNAQNLMQYFSGVAVRNVKTMQPYSAYSQTSGTTVSTTATQATIGSTTIVVNSTLGIVVGQAVEGFGIAPNTLVVSISSTTVTLSLATTGVLATTNVTFTSSTSGAVGYFDKGTMGEVLERGSVTVVATYGTPQTNFPVYVRTAANSNLAGTSVGDFEAADDVSTTSITITTTLGSTALTTSAGTGLAAGQRITGAGIPNNTYLVSGATTSWVMSNGAIAAVTAGAASFSNMALLGSLVDPWLTFRTGNIDSNNVAEITLKSRHAA